MKWVKVVLDKLYCVSNKYLYPSELPSGDRSETFLASCVPERYRKVRKSGPEVIKHFSCSTQLSMQFFLLINVKMPTIVGILTFMNRKI